MLLLPAPGKVNLCLAVRGRRDDGFHDIDTVAVAIDWHDLVGIAVRRAERTAVRLRVTGPGAAAAPAGGANLAWRAAEAFAAAAGGAVAIDLWLDKRLPALAGLGGGSADAAAVLRALARTWPGPAPSAAAMAELGASLGSDVPLLLAGGAVRARGRGEHVTQLAAAPLHLAVVVAGSSSTAAAYAAVRDFEDEDEADGRVDRVADALARGDPPADADLGSGLEAPACRVDAGLDENVTALRAAIPECCWHMTGSGGAMFAVTTGHDEARELVDCAARLGMPGRACRTVAAAG